MSGFSFEGIGASEEGAITEPRRIFASLPNRDERFDFPRDVQTEVWEIWHRRRHERDLTIKMNTGSGKTVVGLVALLSCLNEGAGPAMYLVPDHVLREQVMATAKALGIQVTEDEDSPEFRQGEAILVAVAQKLFNGLSRFGILGAYRQPIDVGSIVIDDAHSIISTVEAQFAMQIPRDNDAYRQLFELFQDELAEQSRSGAAEIAAGDVGAIVAVPYWAWTTKLERARTILAAIGSDKPFVFEWPLIKQHLELAQVAFATDEIEIRLPFPDLNMLPSFSNARRRIYMTATLADDGSLVTSMGADAASVSEPIVPDTAGDLGDRIMLMPLVNDRSITNDRLKQLLAEKARSVNVVVLVPSYARAEEWRPYTNEIHNRETAAAAVARLTNGHVGLVVLISKYDGVDLPGPACRILVLDGLPEFYGPIERREALILGDSPAMRARQLQRIEQGMGRGVRGANDYCAVILMDPRLVERLYRESDIALLSPGTAAQFRLSQQVNKRLRGRGEDDFLAALDMFLARDTTWTTPSKRALDRLAYPKRIDVDETAIGSANAFLLALDGRYHDADRALQDIIRAARDGSEAGWLREQAASYLHHVDPVAARATQGKALLENARLHRVDATPHLRVSPVNQQADAAYQHLRTNFADADELELRVEAVLADLEPDPTPGSHKRFERALRDLGSLLGFEATTPDSTDNVGPDGLWAAPSSPYWIIECKSETEGDDIIKKYAADLGQHMDWFTENYPPPTFAGVPVMIHKVNKLHPTASMRRGSRIITFSHLAQLRNAVRDYARGVGHSWSSLNVGTVRDNLASFGLNAGTFLTRWSSEPTR